jgi:signal transduction histidine kinase
MRFKRFRHDASDSASLSHDHVTAVHRTPGGELWVGTADGLNRLVNEDGKPGFVRYGREDGLADPSINAIADDEAGNLWISTDSGVSRLDRARKRFTNFDVSDGLLEGGFLGMVVAKMANDTIAFGGPEGISLLYPKRVRELAPVPQVALTGFSLFNSLLSRGSLPDGVEMAGPSDRLQALTLSYRHLVFAFDFAALNFADASRSRYAYKLEGFDKDWVPASPSNRRATYTNLDPGEYVFRVKAAYKDGPWNDKDIAVKLTITPPFWKTLWFRGMLFLLAVRMFYVWFRWYTRYMARHYEVEGMAVRARAELDSVAVQHRFIAMVSHEFRNPLALMDVTLKNMQRGRAELSTQMDERLQKIQRAQQRMQGLIDNYLTEEAMKMPDLRLRRQDANLRTLLLDVVSYTQAATSRHALTLAMPDVMPDIFIDREMIRVALSNLLDNAVKYSTAGGKIDVAVSFDERQVTIEVKDQGVGIPEEALPHIFDKFFRANHGTAHIQGVGLGLHLVKCIIELHHGSIAAASRPAEETVFTVQLPFHSSLEQDGTGNAALAMHLKE